MSKTKTMDNRTICELFLQEVANESVYDDAGGFDEFISYLVCHEDITDEQYQQLTYDNVKKHKEIRQKLAEKTFELIKEFAEAGEDYSLLQNTYNDMIVFYGFDLPMVRWIDNNSFETYYREEWE